MNKSIKEVPLKETISSQPLHEISRPLQSFVRPLLMLLRKLTNDETYIRIRFFVKYKRFLNLKNPDTFFAKINWLKLNQKDPLFTKIVDKYEVRKHIKEKIGQEYLIELLGVYNSAEAIDFDDLPSSFVLKPTHGSDWVLLCKDKSEFDIVLAKKTLRKWLKSNYYKMWGEYIYKDVPPRIICEKMLTNLDGSTIVDYKIYCFNGEPKFIHTDKDKYKNHTLDFYDLKWNRLPFGLLFPRSEEGLPKPKSLQKMIEIATILSKDFKFVRVDLYEENGRIYFGELTFYPCNGFGNFYPPSMDYEMGKLINL
ncbi:ATP-grasp fold amidoligase family protein [Eudoraea adriatica]|uniref:ATP-grasp fold amidoligase family protein n=1 Tax=Eudoraea adriatica TaxID=446681 RepID=UPI001F0B418C|nr:ATP-grasp fold amidoligase family protein [Eudoraea adriatica]